MTEQQRNLVLSFFTRYVVGEDIAQEAHDRLDAEERQFLAELIEEDAQFRGRTVPDGRTC